VPSCTRSRRTFAQEAAAHLHKKPPHICTRSRRTFAVEYIWPYKYRKALLQCVAVCCSVLQCVAGCNLRYFEYIWPYKYMSTFFTYKCLPFLHMNVYLVMRYARYDSAMIAVAATHCNTLQHTATHCNTLQHSAQDAAQLQPHITVAAAYHSCSHIYMAI